MPADLDPLLLSLLEVSSAGGWDRWLDMLRRVFGAAAAVLVPLAALARAHAGRGGSAPALADLGAWTVTLRTGPAGELPTAQVVRLADDHGNASGLAAPLALGENRQALLLRRDGAHEAFTAEDAAALGRVAGYVERVLVLHRSRLVTEAEGAALRQVLNQSQSGFLLLDGSFRVLFANSVAHCLLSEDETIGLRAGQLVARSRADERRFQDALEQALACREKHAVVPLHGAADEVEVVATVGGIATMPPSAIEFGFARAAIVVRLSGVQQKRTELVPGHLEAIFAFTPKEALVANLLAAGLALNDVAGELSITSGTARHHLKSIFAKTGLHRQRDLVHLLRMSLPLEALPAAGG